MHPYCSFSQKRSDNFPTLDSYIEKLAERNYLKKIGLDDKIRFSHFSELINENNNKTMDKDIVKEIIATMKEANSHIYNGAGCKGITDYVSLNMDYRLDDSVNMKEFSITDRNLKWVPLIENSINKQSSFIAVGFRHLFYKTGLIKLLESKGFKLTPIPLK